MHTKDMLAQELEKIGQHEMAAKAKLGYYHDFLSPLDFPEMKLVDDLAKVGKPEAMALRKRVIDGDFDASTEESEEWAASPEGKAAFDELLKPGRER